ncbi:unnamed protein product, partial [Allacma fusca]
SSGVPTALGFIWMDRRTTVYKNFLTPHDHQVHHGFRWIGE